MTAQIGLAIPFLVIFIMVVVGTDLRFADFSRIRRRPILILGIVMGQWGLLVLVAGLSGWLLNLPPAITGGAILFASAPVAALSGYYAKLADGDVALAVTVTAISNLLAVVVTPIAASLGFWWFLHSEQATALPVAKIAQQTVIGLLLPLLAGMSLQHCATNWIVRWRGVLQGGGTVAIMIMLGLVIVDQFGVLRAQAGQLFAAAMVFTLAMLASGGLALKLFFHSDDEWRGLLWGFPARNVAIATLAATSVMGQMAIASFIAVLFATQISLLMPLALWLRFRSRRQPQVTAASAIGSSRA